MLPDNEGEKLKTFLLSTTTTTPPDPGFSMTTTSDAPTVWTTLPPPSQLDKDPEIATISEAYGQSSSTTSLTSSVSTPYQYNSYPTQYAMYTSAANPASYYQQMASNLRAQNTFPYTLATPTYAAYTAGNYPVDYTATASAYPGSYYTNIRGSAYSYPLNSAVAAYASVANSLTSDTVLGGTGGNIDVSAIGSSTSSASFNLKEKKQKAKKKKAGSCSPGDETYARVFIWDLEDIAVISRNFLGTLAHAPNYLGYSAPANTISHLMDNIAISSFSDINEVLEGDVTNIEDAVVDDTVMDGGPIDSMRGLDVMRRVAPKYAAFRQFYTDISGKMLGNDGFKQEQSVLSYDLLERIGMGSRDAELCQAAIHLQNYPNFGQRWQCAQRCMDLVVKRSAESTDKYANVVLSNDGIVYGAAQLLIAGLSGAVPIENVYSVSKQGKEAILEKIQTRYGKKCSFICVTSSDTANIAKRQSIPVWPLQNNSDLDKLFNAQTNYLLG